MASQSRKFLTFDLGTTLYKVALFDDSGNLLALERATPPIDRPQPPWAEVRADEFMRVLIEATKRLGDLSDVAAATFATQANSFTLLDERGEPVTPFILWSDQRAGGLAALAKVQWLRRHQPDVFERARRLCFISDYLCARYETAAGVAGLSSAVDLD